MLKLKPLEVDQIEARDMDSIAVLKASPERFAREAQWAFAPGGDDLDEFDAAVFEVEDLGSFSVLSYRGQPPGTTSVLVPVSLVDEVKRTLLELVLKAGRLQPASVAWSTVAVTETPAPGRGQNSLLGGTAAG